MRIRQTLRFPHSLLPEENEFIGRLLPAALSHRELLLAHAAAARVRWVESFGQPAILFDVPQTVTRLPPEIGRIVYEREARDSDGASVQLLVHVLDGILAEIEMYREDGNPLHELPMIQ